LLNIRNGRRCVPPDKCDAVGEVVNRGSVALPQQKQVVAQAPIRVALNARGSAL
jgi:hypothetical protein